MFVLFVYAYIISATYHLVGICNNLRDTGGLLSIFGTFSKGETAFWLIFAAYISPLLWAIKLPRRGLTYLRS